MYEVFKASKPFMEVVAAGFDLTPQQVFAIKSLDEDRPMTMSAFATTLGCDASNVTSIVDKLETRGIVERRASALDRRVKVLVMTPAGIELRGRIADAMQNPPPAIANLSIEDQEALCAIYRRALDTL
jgi:DNA-binding MarR family transcriptional regulator